MRKGIHFDELIRHRVNRFYVIDLFIRTQRKKKKNILRRSLHNQTIENIHKIYNREISEYISYQDTAKVFSADAFYTNTVSIDPFAIVEPDDTPLCFIHEDHSHLD